jgi:MEMO1 family protein
MRNILAVKTYKNLIWLIRQVFYEKILNIFLLLMLVSLLACKSGVSTKNTLVIIRPLKDTVGFAQYSWQMDSLMARIRKMGWSETKVSDPWKLAICPHDDYTYVGKLYPELLQNIKAPNLILIGVAHKAAQFGIEDSLVFDSYSRWKGPWKEVIVSSAREQIFKLLSKKYALINDTLQKTEHSIEALIPYLQYFNKNISIIPILVPAMSPDRMQSCGKALAEAIKEVAGTNGWEWGKDIMPLWLQQMPCITEMKTGVVLTVHYLAVIIKGI